ncbi:3-dehydroquinate synthase [Pseudobythopirellula maris]|uniref:3-dehydroquinate synthase n=1 Tax=Pseudobythopirellula maris TaxID=2527991 RepID=A0A5C5ZVA8_9BACT|nr:3-dehydroquinate synthase [Pseudobythopirellula maris]TWT91116.1 3-dehydroquinate synthase [Pseudobythopirellula maris]
MSELQHSVRVDLAERGYDIEIGEGVLEGIVDFVQQRHAVSHVAVITDSNVDGLYADAVADRFSDADIETHVLVIDPGESSKDPEVAHDLWQTMIEEGCDRQTMVLAVGGGVVGDLAGFVAATFARGLTFFQAPTTLLAQVDSSVGGKVGVNLEGAKNMVGAFWQPAGVLIDVATLTTLPDREYRAGLAEVVKYGVIMDEPFFAYLEAQADAINGRDSAVLAEIVRRCCRLKADVVEADEREESGRRAILNYGHTFCHALEAATNYTRLLHGEGVAIGMLCASRLAERLGRIGADVTSRQHALLEKLGLPLTAPADLDPDELVRLMWRDKKVSAGKLNFILPSRLGEVELVADPPVGDVRDSLGLGG